MFSWKTIHKIPFIFLIAFTSLKTATSDESEREWLQKTSMENDGSSYYGRSIGMSESFLAVGAPYTTPSSDKKDAGSIQILKRNGDKLEVAKEIFGDALEQLGETVAISKGPFSGDSDNQEVVIVGAPRSSKGGRTNAGLARVFFYSKIKDEWIQMGQDLIGSWENELFGETVAVSDDGKVICVGTSKGDEVNHGRVDIFQYNEFTNFWDELGLPMQGDFEGAKFGLSISITQKKAKKGELHNYYVAIGSPDVNYARGLVQVFHWNEDLADWEQVGRDIEGPYSQDQLGQSVSIAMKGSILFMAVGIPSARYYGGEDQDTDDDSSHGRVQVYRFDTNLDEDTTEWVPIGDEILQVDDADGTGEMVELSVDGALLAIGSPQYDNGSGMVRVYEYDFYYDEYSKVGKTLYGRNSEAFGTSLSFHESDLAIGSPYENYVQVFSYAVPQVRKKSFIGRFITTTIMILIVVAFCWYGYKKLRLQGFKWGSLAAALPGAAAFRRHKREAVSTVEQRDPIFLSQAETTRTEEIRKTEEGRKQEKRHERGEAVRKVERRDLSFLSEAESRRLEEIRRAEEGREQEKRHEREKVSKVERRDLPFLSEAETKRLEEIRRAEEAREQESSNVDRVVLHGMPRTNSRPEKDGEKASVVSDDGSYDSLEDSLHQMRQIT